MKPLSSIQKAGFIPPRRCFSFGQRGTTMSLCLKGGLLPGKRTSCIKVTHLPQNAPTPPIHCRYRGLSQRNRNCGKKRSSGGSARQLLRGTSCSFVCLRVILFLVWKKLHEEREGHTKRHEANPLLFHLNFLYIRST